MLSKKGFHALSPDVKNLTRKHRERMKSVSGKDNRLSTVPESHLSGTSLWNPCEQIKNSHPKGIVSCFESSPNFSDHGKQSKSQFQEQDSSSTLSTCQTHYATTGNTTRNNTTVQNLRSLNGIDGTSADHQKGSSLRSGNTDYLFGQVQFDYNHQMACIPYQWAESCVGALVAAYGPNALVYPQMLGINQHRVPIPLDCEESLPVYVNAKQFRAILRRRQIRAKLEAEKKILKARKPYLHESRHRHALKRERGPGGRFLNKKDTNNQSNASVSEQQRCQQQEDFDVVDGSGNNGHQHSTSESGSWEETSTPSSLSDVTSIFNGEDIFHMDPQQHQHGHVGDDLTLLETGNRLFLSI